MRTWVVSPTLERINNKRRKELSIFMACSNTVIVRHVAQAARRFTTSWTALRVGGVEISSSHLRIGNSN